ncbi:hypothetical protein M3Y94_00985700 [Aphelenchoides besseyi]|nr:hypothetical protein M3Y94_00985700 [Aphelenchoides besseyi]KAI6221099.1 hypothetical protein M3Y95_01005200 [Aphelenchoides besseyi]
MRVSIVLLGFVGILAMLEVGAIKCYECARNGIPEEGYASCDSPKEVECDPGVEVCVHLIAEKDVYVEESDSILLPGMYKTCGKLGTKDSCLFKNNMRVCTCTGNLCNLADYFGSSNRPKIAAFGLLILLFVLA